MQQRRSGYRSAASLVLGVAMVLIGSSGANAVAVEAVAFTGCADANRDGFADLADVLVIMQSSVGLRPCPLCVCDVNADGSVSPTDAIDVMLGLIGAGDDPRCSACAASVCGDGVTGGAEECDDGNPLPDDGCGSTCLAEYCGDGIVNDGAEHCEPPGVGSCMTGCVADTLADLTQLGSIIARVTEPRGGGSRQIEVIRDGDRPEVGSSASLRQYDGYDGDDPAAEDWIGYAYPGPQTFARLVLTEGKHFVNGGWFEDPGVQVRQNGQWLDVRGQVVSPRYPGLDDGMNFETYSFDFEHIVGDAIRLHGAPGGISDFISVAELEVFGMSHTCGDGVRIAGEGCDDGNSLGGDGCSPGCDVEDESGLCAGERVMVGTALALEVVAEGLHRPVHIAAPRLDSRRLFVVEQRGRVRVIREGELLEQPFLSMEGRLSTGGEQGLLSIAFHPDYSRNRLFFVAYSDLNGDTVVARFMTYPGLNGADPASERTLLTIQQPLGNHNGGQLAFGADGYLYVGLGDGGGGGDPFEVGQDDSTLLGKMLRLDVDVNAPPYHAAPADNPGGMGGAATDLIWASGLRNPWRFSFDRDNGDLYIADVGQGAVEEINWQAGTSSGGENYGWDIFEGSQCFEPSPASFCPAPPLGYTMPVHEYGHVEGCSITGGHVYRGCAMPGVRGMYFYADFCTPWIKSFRVVGATAQSHVDHTAMLAASTGVPSRISTFGEDARGEIYLAGLIDGRIYKLVPAP